MQPAEGIHFIHAAICREAAEIEALAAQAATPKDAAAIVERVKTFARVLKLHTEGEEGSLLEDLEGRLPHVRDAYVLDHRDEERLVTEVIAAAERVRSTADADALTALRRVVAALAHHVLLHVRKENELLVPLLVSLYSPAEQAAQAGRMMAAFPAEELRKVVPWLVSRLEESQAAAYVAMVKAVAPEERFRTVAGWIKEGVEGDVWRGICARVEGLGE
jgi:hypothetical protein